MEDAFGDSPAAGNTGELFRRALAGEEVDSQAVYRGRELAARYVPLRDEAGVVVGALALWLDVTDRKRGEEQLRQAQKLESIGLLAGAIAHDPITC